MDFILALRCQDEFRYSHSEIVGQRKEKSSSLKTSTSTERTTLLSLKLESPEGDERSGRPLLFPQQSSSSAERGRRGSGDDGGGEVLRFSSTALRAALQARYSSAAEVQRGFSLFKARKLVTAQHSSAKNTHTHTQNPRRDLGCLNASLYRISIEVGCRRRRCV